MPITWNDSSVDWKSTVAQGVVRSFSLSLSMSETRVRILQVITNKGLKPLSRRLSMCSILKKKTINHIEWLRIHQTHISLFITINNHSAMNYNERFDKVLGIKGRDLIPKCTTSSVPEGFWNRAGIKITALQCRGGRWDTNMWGTPKTVLFAALGCRSSWVWWWWASPGVHISKVMRIRGLSTVVYGSSMNSYVTLEIDKSAKWVIILLLNSGLDTSHSWIQMILTIKQWR